MDYKVKFDRTVAPWVKDDECNMMFLRMQEIHSNELLKHKGYIYLNRIYEDLGIEWNPRNENPCFTSDKYSRVSIIPWPLGDFEYEVTIGIQ